MAVEQNLPLRGGGGNHHPLPPTTTSSSSPPVDGRVLLLHFSCRAALPPGSNLRVTGSTLWAPSALTTSPSNPNENDSSAVLPGVSPSAPAASATSQQNDPDEDYNHTGVGGTFGGLHTSSVEMVTSPDMYPVWTTRTPVVVVAASNSNSSNLGGGEGVFRHRYRYLVVTPGADLDHGGAEEENLLRGGSSSTSLSSGGTGGGSSSHGSGGGGVPAEVLSRRGGGGASTTNDKEGSFPVMMWEDPFLEEEERVDALQSTSSLPSIQRAALARRDLVNLPYRTLDLDVSSVNSLTFGKSVNLAAAAAAAGAEEGGVGGGNVEYTMDGVRVDVWNEKGDEAFGPYLEEQESRETPDKDMDTDIFPDGEDDDEDIINEQQDDGSPTTKSSTTRLWLVCFHLPVILTRNPNTNTWSACWSESLIAKTEQSGVTKLLETRWIGTVSAVPSITSEAERNAVRAVLEPMNCTPLFLDEDVEEAHYMGMCKQVLWPAFHNVDLLDLSTSGWGQREQQQPHFVDHTLETVAGGQHQPSSMPTSAPGVPPSPQRQQPPPTSPRPQQQRQASLSGVVSSSPGSPIRYQYPSAAPPVTLGGGGPIPPVPTTTATTTNPYMSSGENKSDWDQSRLDGWWKAYQSVNQTFADAIIQNLQPQDTIWVHDYHLLLLPKLLDEAERNVRIDKRRTIKMVFFLHIPFPTSQVFRELQHGEMILEGMLHADVVGFHAFDHARHFLNASKRILGLAYESLMGGLIGVRFRGKKILITMRNVSIEPDIVDGALALPSVKAGANTLKRKHGKRTIVAGVDVAQRLSGISLKLLAYERLLTDYPNWRPLVVMVQKCLISGSRRYDEADTLREVRTLVRRIQDTFGPKVIDYEELVGTSLPIDQRLAIWTSADVLMSTPIREGLNLLPLEYVFARGGKNSPGVTIASEFSASRSILNGALRVNPYDIPMSAMSIDKALSMDLNEKEARRARDIDFVSSCPSGLWTTNVLRDLNDATAGSYNADLEAVDSPEAMFSRENELSVSPLELDSVVSAYNVTSRRVIIMDFNGTLVMKEPAGKYLKREILGTTGNKPPTAVMAALAALCADKRNTVYVVSGDSQKNLEDALGSIPGLGLAASNGGCFANPTPLQFGGGPQGMYEREWQTFDLGVDWKAVQKVALPILSKYTARTNGSFVKLTHSSIGWSYYSCDPEWGSLQASYLVPELEHELRAYDVRFTTLKGVVEVVPRKLNKGLIVKKVLTESAMRPSSPSSPPQQQPEESNVDFILCVGDDISDEKMFTAVFSFIAESVSPSAQGALALPTAVAPDTSMMDEEPTPTASSWEKNKQQRQMYAFTVAVGKKPTHASRYVEGAGDVANLLISMSGTTELANSGRSMSWETEEMQTDFFE